MGEVGIQLSLDKYLFCQTAIECMGDLKVPPSPTCPFILLITRNLWFENNYKRFIKDHSPIFILLRNSLRVIAWRLCRSRPSLGPPVLHTVASEIWSDLHFYQVSFGSYWKMDWIQASLEEGSQLGRCSSNPKLWIRRPHPPLAPHPGLLGPRGTPRDLGTF